MMCAQPVSGKHFVICMWSLEDVPDRSRSSQVWGMCLAGIFRQGGNPRLSGKSSWPHRALSRWPKIMLNLGIPRMS